MALASPCGERWRAAGAQRRRAGRFCRAPRPGRGALDASRLRRACQRGFYAVHRAVRLIAETASAIPWLLYEGAAELDDHPLLRLLERPNQRQAGATFLEALYGHLLLAGNAYVEMIEAGEDARELHLLRPDRVAVLADASGWPSALEYREGAAKRKTPI